MNYKKINIAIVGFGNIGSYFYKNLISNKKNIITKTGKIPIVKYICAKNLNKKRNIKIPKKKWIKNPLNLVSKNDVDVIVELIGGSDGMAKKLVFSALKKGKHVITANKALISKHGNELAYLAEKNNVNLEYEASVAGGVPIIRSIKEGLIANKINKVYGILNGTTNYILTTMETQNKSFDDVLDDAKKRGFTSDNESKLDIGGYDAAHKITLLSTIAFGGNVDFNLNQVEGIEKITIEDINFVKHLGFRIKLISESFLIDNMICSSTKPKLIPLDKPLANVDGALNAINVETDQLENLYLEGEGAGGLATASSILSDIFEISNNSNFRSIGYNINDLKNYQKFDSSNLESKFYLRLRVKDQPGVLSKITTYLNDSNISVEKILQTPDKKENNIPILIITHKIKTSELLNSVNKISDLEFVNENISIIPIE